MNTRAEQTITALREVAATLLDRAILAEGRVRATVGNLEILEARDRAGEEDLREGLRQALREAQTVCRVIRIDVQDLFDDVAETLTAMGYDSTYRDENGFAHPLPEWARAVYRIVMEAEYMLITLQAQGYLTY